MKMIRTGLSAALLCLLYQHPATAESFVVDAPSTGVEVGLGWDSKRNRLVPSRCINFAPIQEGGQYSTVEVSEINSASELQQHLGVSASAQIKGLIGSASASASFVQNTKVTSTTTNFAVRAAVTNGVMFIGPSKPTNLRRFAFSSTQPITVPLGTVQPEPDAASNQYVQLAPWLKEVKADPTDAQQAAAFQRLCGDGYVSAIYSGVELFTVISFDQTKSSSSNEMKAKVAASYGIGAGSASYDQSEEKNFEAANTRMSFLQRGGAGGSLPIGREQLAEKLATLAREAEEAPEFFDIEITPYSDLPGWWGAPVDSHQPYIDIMAERYLQLKTIYRDLEDVIAEGSNRYSMCFGSELYQNLQDRIARTLALMESTQAAVEANDWDSAAQNTFLAELQKLDIDAPPETVFDLRRGPDQVNQTFTPPKPVETLVQWLDDHLSVVYLKTLLPPLKSDSLAACNDTVKPAYQKAVIDQYIKPISQRVCARSVSDPDCLSNRALALLQEQVSFPSTVDLVPGAEGFLCIGGFSPTRRCISSKQKGAAIQLTDRADEAALVKVEAVENTPDQVRLVIYTPALGDTPPTEVHMAVGAAEPGHPGIRGVNDQAQGGAELRWQIRTVYPNQPQSKYLYAVNSTNRPSKINKVTRNDCLLWEPWSNNLFIYPNNCVTSANNKPYYSWMLYAADDQ